MILHHHDEHTTPADKFEHLMATRFTIAPERSSRAYEEFCFPDGEVARLHHYVFGYITEGREEDAGVVLFNALWDVLKKAWPPGTFLMWRRLPEVAVYNDKDPGWFDRGAECPEPSSPDNWKTKVTIRIGSFTKPSVEFVGEGCQLPVLKEK